MPTTSMKSESQQRVGYPITSRKVRKYYGAHAPISPYMVSSPFYAWENWGSLTPDMAVDRDWSSYSQHYARPTTKEPLSDSMMDLLRRELEDIFYETIATALR
ncbi:hypothetical protein F4804DRAFT_97804 [Jackrogersella minutella]|nr:hypothetical protein F4804DRAFT_97804 [Jackrogersella minutella]